MINNHRPWFGRFGWGVFLLIMLASILAVVLSGCNPAKQAMRKEAKAASILAESQVRAAKLCPSCVFQDTVTTKADSAVVPMVFSDIDHAGMLIQCREALEAARADLRNAPDTIRVPVQTLSPRARKAVEAIRSNVCQFDPIRYESDAVRVEVRPGAKEPLLSVEELPRKLVCPPCVGKTVYKEAPRVQQWGWIGVLVGLVLGVGFTLFMVGAFKKA